MERDLHPDPRSPRRSRPDLSAGFMPVDRLFDIIGRYADPLHRFDFIAKFGGHTIEPRTWFDRLLLNPSDETTEWMTLLAMTRKKFLWLCYQIIAWSATPGITSSMVNQAEISFPQQVAATVNYLRGNSFEDISRKLGPFPDILLFHRVIDGCVLDIAPACGKCITFGRFQLIKEGWKIPNCQGAVGFTRVKFLPWPSAGDGPPSRPPWQMIIMAVCDKQGRYMDFDCASVAHASNNLQMFRGTRFHAHFLDQFHKLGPGGDHRLLAFVVDLPHHEELPEFAGTDPFLFDPPPENGAGSSHYNPEYEVRRKLITEAVDGELKDLKKVFRSLETGIQCPAPMAPHYVHACMILHNIVRDDLDDLRHFFD